MRLISSHFKDQIENIKPNEINNQIINIPTISDSFENIFGIKKEIEQTPTKIWDFDYRI